MKQMTEKQALRAAATIIRQTARLEKRVRDLDCKVRKARAKPNLVADIVAAKKGFAS